MYGPQLNLREAVPSASVWAVSLSKSGIDVQSVFTLSLQVFVVMARSGVKQNLPPFILFDAPELLPGVKYLLYMLCLFIMTLAEADHSKCDSKIL